VEVRIGATPSHIVPRNVFADVIRIAQGELVLSDRLLAASERVDQFLADLREYEVQHPELHARATALKERLRRKLKAASRRWIGTEEVAVLREAHARLAGHPSIGSKASDSK
jgi:hypothetical protein